MASAFSLFMRWRRCGNFQSESLQLISVYRRPAAISAVSMPKKLADSDAELEADANPHCAELYSEQWFCNAQE